jgi:predicted RNA binding protein YcfA (HicA-like mRNA interferase family)
MMIERDSRKIIKRLKDEGYEQVAVRGSHHKFRKGDIVLVVPHPKRDLPIGTAKAIARQAGWL